MGKKLRIEDIAMVPRPNHGVADEGIIGGGNGRVYLPDMHTDGTNHN